MDVTKTTLHLEPALHTELKATAARLQKSVRSLLEEGARLVLDRYQGSLDRQQLKVRARAAVARMRQGYGGNDGGHSSQNIDELLYAQSPLPLPRVAEPWNMSSSTPGRSSPRRTRKTRGTRKR